MNLLSFNFHNILKVNVVSGICIHEQNAFSPSTPKSMKWVVLTIQNPPLANTLVRHHRNPLGVHSINEKQVLRKYTHLGGRGEWISYFYLNHLSWETPTLKLNSGQRVVRFRFLSKEGFQGILSFIIRAACVDLYQIIFPFCLQAKTSCHCSLPANLLHHFLSK